MDFQVKYIIKLEELWEANRVKSYTFLSKLSFKIHYTHWSRFFLTCLKLKLKIEF